MLEFLHGNASERKLRLFSCACCRRIARLLTHEPGLRAVEVAEQYADARQTREELDQAAEAVWPLCDPPTGTRPRYAVIRAHVAAATAATPDLSVSRALAAAAAAVAAAASDRGSPRLHSCCPFQGAKTEEEAWVSVRSEEFKDQAVLLRDLVGNPFLPVSLDPAWLTWREGTIPKLAQAVYDDRGLPNGHVDNGCLAILADALEDAGCDNGDILNHCRQPGEHWRGCWVVDLLLGKE
jgi:hypothetical protein